MRQALISLCLIVSVAGYLLMKVTGTVDTNLQNNFFEQRPTSENWIGADGTYSIDLGFGNVLFGWQDSWLGTVNNNIRYRSGFVRNSVGKAYTKDGQPTSSIRFSYRKDGQNPSIFKSFDSNHVDWPAGGVLINGRLHVVTMTVANGLSQTHYGWHCIVNPYDDPLTWGDFPSHYPFTGVAWNRAIAHHDGFVYVLGGRSGVGPYSEKAVMSRFHEDDIAFCNYDKRQCWGMGFGIPLWTSDCRPENLVALYDNPSETTLEWNDTFQKWVSWRITFGDTSIWIGTADAPQGPWKFTKAWDYPDYVKNTKLWGTYHPKAHPMLSKTSAEMLVTFSSNINDADWDLLARTPWIYVPFPVRMSLSTSLNWQLPAKAGTYHVVAKTSQMVLAFGPYNAPVQYYPLSTNAWNVSSTLNGMFTISIKGLYISIDNGKLLPSYKPYPWKIVPTMDESNYYIIGANGTLALSNRCHAHESAFMAVEVFWNIQYPCQKWTLM